MMTSCTVVGHFSKESGFPALNLLVLKVKYNDEHARMYGAKIPLKMAT